MKELLDDKKFLWILVSAEEDIEDGVRYTIDGERDRFLAEANPSKWDLKKSYEAKDKLLSAKQKDLRTKEKEVARLKVENSKITKLSDSLYSRILAYEKESVWKHILRNIKAYKQSVTTSLRGKRK